MAERDPRQPPPPGASTRPTQPQAPAQPPGPERPSGHYRRGNRLYELKAWEQARAEWRQAVSLWTPARAAHSLRDRLAGLLAVLLLLATVLLVYYVLFSMFPRDPFEMLMASGAFQTEERSWWQQFLDTGRPSEGQGHKLGIREWWERFSQRFGEEQRQAGGERFRPSIDERWAELLRRYNRWGPMLGENVDHQVVAAQGLTQQGEFERAVTILKTAIGRTGETERLGELYQSLATTYYFQGYQLQKDQLASYDLKLVRLSAEAYEQSIRYQPRVLSYGNLGWAYFLLGDYELAERMSLRALSYDESLEYVRLNLGLIYLVQDRYGRAFSAYRRVAALGPPPESYLGGISDLKEIIRDNPGRYPFAHLMIAYLDIRRGDLPEARRHLEQFLAAPDIGGRWREMAQEWRSRPAAALDF